MQSSSLHRTKSIPIFSGKHLSSAASLVGVVGFMLSLVMALLLLQGNPGMLLVWFAAAATMVAVMRFHRKWRDTFEQIYAINPARTILAARKDWRRTVEDVAFRDLPQQPASGGQ